MSEPTPLAPQSPVMYLVYGKAGDWGDYREWLVCGRFALAEAEEIKWLCEHEKGVHTDYYHAADEDDDAYERLLAYEAKMFDVNYRGSYPDKTTYEVRPFYFEDPRQDPRWQEELERRRKFREQAREKRRSIYTRGAKGFLKTNLGDIMRKALGK